MQLLHSLLLSALAGAARAQSELPALVPAVHSYTPSDGPAFTLPSSLSIVVDEDSADVRDTDGLTLLPPSLHEFAETFADDVRALFPGTSVNVSLGAWNASGDIFMSVAPDMNATLASGAWTSEGYALNVTDTAATIAGAGARGAFWGSRTLLQGLVLRNGSFPAGAIADQPDWGTRGVMLDAGRQWYPAGFLQELCSYGSWFKANELHAHLSDNVSPVLQDNDPATTYARFRLRPESPALAGLAPHTNETYSKAEFEELQRHCAARGVTVIPEIESPGHALAITQWKPELALASDATLINLTAPDALSTVQAIWAEFLPIFHTKQVSIGADEYDADLADDYIAFVNSMSEFIGESNKTIRIWGTNEPSNTSAVSKDITIQHWEWFEDDPVALVAQGYTVINSDDFFNYIVMKYSGSYPQELNQTRLWEGAGVNTSGAWDPHIFDRGSTNNPALSSPLVQGSIMACWNDHGPWASTYLEAFYAVKRGLPVTAANAWQSPSRPNRLTRAQYESSFDALEVAPGQNLDRRVASKSAVVVDYEPANATRAVPDLSGNGYDARVVDGTVHTPLGSKGHNYTLRLVAGEPIASGTLLSGPDDAFGVAGGTLAFVSSGITYPLINYTLPSAGWTQIVLRGTEAGTEALVDGARAGEFRVYIDGTRVSVPLAFVAPLQSINKKLARFTLWDGIVDV